MLRGDHNVQQNTIQARYKNVVSIISRFYDRKSEVELRGFQFKLGISNINFIFRLLRSHHVAKAPIVAVDVFFMKRQPNAQMVSVFQLYILLKLFRPAQDRITKN